MGAGCKTWWPDLTPMDARSFGSSKVPTVQATCVARNPVLQAVGPDPRALAGVAEGPPGRQPPDHFHCDPWAGLHGPERRGPSQGMEGATAVARQWIGRPVARPPSPVASRTVRRLRAVASRLRFM